LVSFFVRTQFLAAGTVANGIDGDRPEKFGFDASMLLAGGDAQKGCKGLKMLPCGREAQFPRQDTCTAANCAMRTRIKF
jgi:hypothetical protein